ncbi:MAG: tetratricopeptide repeat protein [Acidobacteria bacterium]|nr:tetratricopeptide repeat protein [Acidobacteriota bacterium]
MPLMSRFLSLLFLGVVLSSSAGIAAEDYQLIGKIFPKGREFSRRALPVVLLEGTRTFFAAHTRSDLAGNFRFKNLQPDLFTLIVFIPQAGEYRKTVEISPSLADSKKRIFVDVEFQPNLGSKVQMEASLAMLSVPEKAWKEYEKARKKLGSRDAEGAIAHLKKTISIAPQFVEAWNTLGTLAYKSRDFRLAESYFREALKRNPEYFPSVVNLGGALLSQGKIHDSLPFNIAAVEARPDDALAHSQLGLSYFYLEKFPEAEKHLKKAISLDPGHFSYPQLTLAEIYFYKNDLSLAAGEIDQFLKLHPDAEQSVAIKKRIERIRTALNTEKNH